MEITESQKVLLAKLFFRNSDRYHEKLAVLGVQGTEISDYIDRERQKQKELAAINLAPFRTYRVKKSNPSTKSHIKNSSVKPSSDLPKLGAKSTPRKQPEVSNTNDKVYILVDGDNYPYQNMRGYEKIKNKPEYEVTIYVANDSMARRYGSKFRAHVQIVPAGCQAVDNRIKSIVGSIVKERTFKKIIIISHDRDYGDKIEVWKKRYMLSNRDIVVCKTIESAV